LYRILALFGEKFATQFASESLDWLDHLIFAMVPLGIITAMTAAIRVQGPSVAQAFIGRARENVASAEIELMSSTSNEVCELFNGKGIVRAMGKAGIKQILVFPSLYEEERNRLQQEDGPPHFLTNLKGKESPACGIHTIATACGYNPISLLGAPITGDGRLGWKDAVMAGRGTHLFLRHNCTQFFFFFSGRDIFSDLTRGPDYRGYFHTGITRAEMTASLIFNRFLGRWLRSMSKPTERKSHDMESGSFRRRPDIGLDTDDYDDYDYMDWMSPDSWLGTTDSEQRKALRRLGPPNLQLNNSRPNTDHEEYNQKLLVLGISVTGVILQLGLVAIAGLVTYHEPTKISVGYDEKSYGFPSFAAGSFSLCLGMGVCSYIIGRSTVEWSWEPVKDERSGNLDPYLFWIQKAQNVNDQTFGPYAIPAGPRRRIITSSRQDTQKPDSRNTWGIVTMFGVLAAIAGFILQFIGLRALPYPVSFAQLGGILVMALLRAVMRNKTRRRLESFETLARYELDYLASRIAFHEEFLPEEPRSSDDEKSVSPRGVKRHRWRVLSASDYNGDKFYFKEINPARMEPNTGNWQPDKDAKIPDTTVEDMQSGEKQNAGPGSGGRGRGKTVSSQQLLRVRQRLGYVTTWQSAASSTALALSRSMVYVLSELVKDPRKLHIDGKEPSGFKQDDTICMNITLPTATRAEAAYGFASPDAGDEDLVTIRCFWDAMESEHNDTVSGSWKVDPDSLDAVLSLWMAYVEETHTPGLRPLADDGTRTALRQPAWFDPGASTPTYRYRRILGDNFYGSGLLKRDLRWWVDGFSEQLLTPRRDSDAQLIIGFNGLESLGSYIPLSQESTELGIDSCLPLPKILAQHIFTVFMWTLAQHLPPSCLGQGLPAHMQEVEITQSRKFLPQQFGATWSEPALRHRGLSKVTQQIEGTGLGDTTEIQMCMIPALSFADLLPNEVMLSILPRKTPDWGWSELADCYTELLKTKLGKSVRERFCYEAIVVAIDFLLEASEPFYDPDIGKPWRELEAALKRLTNELLVGYLPILGELLKIYHLQHRFRDVVRALDRFMTIEDVWGRFELKTREAIMSELHSDLDQDPPEINWTETWGAAESMSGLSRKLSLSQGHLDMLRILAVDSSDNSKEHLLQAYSSISTNRGEYDLFGWTPLHYTSLCKDFSIVQKVYGAVQDSDAHGGKRGIFKLRDKCGRNPLHAAAAGGFNKNLQELLNFAEDSKEIAQSAGFDQMTPLHLAVKAGSEDCFNILQAVIKGTTATQSDIWGRKALHIAASLARTGLCEKLLDMDWSRADPEREDVLGHTPLILILKKLNSKKTSEGTRELLQPVAARFLKQVQQIPSQIANYEYDKTGGTLLHLVSKYGDMAIFFNKVDKDDKEQLKKLDADVNRKDNEGQAPLHVAIRARRPDNALFILGRLKGTKDKLDLSETKAGDGLSAISMACEMGLDNVVEELLEQGATIAEDVKDATDATDTADEQHRNLLHFTVGTTEANFTDSSQAKPYEKIIDLLLPKARINDLKAADVNGQTPLIAACITGFTYGVTKILDKALSLTSNQDNSGDPRESGGETPQEFHNIVNHRDIEYDQSGIEYACERGHATIVETLLHGKYKVTPQNVATKWHSYTALHFAVSFAREPAEPWETIAEKLCDAVPAFLAQKDEYGRTPLKLAEERHGEGSRMRQLILSHKNTSFEEKKPFLEQALDEPNMDRVSCVPAVIRSLSPADFIKIFKDPDPISRLAHKESIAAWTDMALAIREEHGLTPTLDIPAHFAVRGYTGKNILDKLTKFKEYWEDQKPGSSADKITRPDGFRREEAPADDVGWSIVDWAKSFRVDADTLKKMRKEYGDAFAKLPNERKTGRKPEITSADTKYTLDAMPTKPGGSKWLEVAGKTSSKSRPEYSDQRKACKSLHAANE